MSKPIDTAPSLPPTSVDFNALHSAIRQGNSAETAIAKATPDEPEQPVEAVPAPTPAKED